MAKKGWQREFEDLNGKPLVTLRDAEGPITKLPKAEHDVAKWQDAACEHFFVINQNEHIRSSGVSV